MTGVERGHAGALVLMLIVAHGGADRSRWHGVGAANVEGIGARIVVVEGADVIVVAVAVAAVAVAIDSAHGIAVAVVVIAAGVGMRGWRVRPVRCRCQRYQGVCCC